MFFKLGINYIKRAFGNKFIIPLLIVGPLFQTFLMKANLSGLSQGTGNSNGGGHVQLIMLGQLMPENMDQLVASSSLVYFIMLAGLVMVGLNVSDRKNNTLMRIYSTSVKRLSVATANITAQALITAFIAAMYIVLSEILFGINWGKSFTLITIVTVIAAVVSASLGFAASTLFRNPKAAVGTVTCILFVSAFLSDSFTLGGQFDDVSKYTINKWAYDAYMLLMQGAGLGTVGVNLAVLLCTAFLLLILGLFISGRERSYE